MVSARKKSGKEEGLTAEESQRLKSLLGRATEPEANASKQVGKEQEALTEEEIKEIDEALGPPTWQQVQLFRKAGRTISKRAAIDQLIEAMPEGTDPSEAYARAAMLFASFLPSDGTEMTLSRLSVAATNAAMDCFARAAKTEEVRIRELELNSATKLALASAALCKALDHHRGPDWPEYIDDTVPRRRLTTAHILKCAGSDPKDDGKKDDDEKVDREKDDREKVNAQKHNGDTKPKDEPRPKVEARSRSSV